MYCEGCQKSPCTEDDPAFARRSGSTPTRSGTCSSSRAIPIPRRRDRTRHLPRPVVRGRRARRSPRGRPAEKDGVPDVYGISTGDGAAMLAEADVDPPSENGAIPGRPARAPEHSVRVAARRTHRRVRPAVPRPRGGPRRLKQRISPLSVSISHRGTRRTAPTRSAAKAQLARRLQENQEESTSAQPLGMYQ
ncbi:hypothetical protein C9J85_03240 [Haloferax sp. wsp5]|nr:hypothetical protein C9J85_03240 [Haloferax sp. wsp5]